MLLKLVVTDKDRNNQSIKLDINDGLTLLQLTSIIEKRVSIRKEHFDILLGYPPELVIGDVEDSIDSFGIKSGVMIYLRYNMMKSEIYQKLINAGYNDDVSYRAMMMINTSDIDLLKDVCLDLSNRHRDNLQHNLHVLRKVIDADNSCLFNAIGYLIHGKEAFSSFDPLYYREIIAGIVLSQPSYYTKELLEKDPDEYAAWIMNKDSWGGEIELSILSSYLGIEIAVFNIISVTVLLYKSNDLSTAGHLSRIYLLYDGIHYDAVIAMKNGLEITQFSSDDQTVESKVQELAKDLNTRKQYTNLARCGLQCNICYTLLSGENDAREHARLTGHQNFGQI